MNFLISKLIYLLNTSKDNKSSAVNLISTELEHAIVTALG